MLLSKSNITPRIRHQPTQKPKFIYEEHPNKGFPPQSSTILVSRKTYQKLSSNGLDLVELEPKPVGYRQIRMDPIP